MLAARWLPWQVYDVFVLGTVVGRLFHQGYAYAWFSTVLATLTMIVLVCVITLVTSASEDMERPFGSDPLDLPCLSYVTGTATATLDMVVPLNAGVHNEIAAAREHIVGRAEADLFGPKLRPAQQVYPTMRPASP